jgi:hypothetical protein
VLLRTRSGGNSRPTGCSGPASRIALRRISCAASFSTALGRVSIWSGVLSHRTEDRRALREIRREWEAAGRPPCPVCCTEFDADDSGKASLLWRGVVHGLCLRATVTGQSEWQLRHDPCPLYPDCPIPRGRFCVCPRGSALHIIILARKFRQSTAKVPTHWSPGSQRAAKEAGLYERYRAVPLLEIPFFDQLRKHGQLAPGLNATSFFQERRDVSVPPEYLTVDVDRSIREGRIVAAES